MKLETVVADLIEKIERRFYGKYRGIVVDNADPESLGRLRMKVPSVLGNGVVTGWALPCAPYGGDAGQGFLFIPEVDAGVWVEFEEGDLEFPIWVGAFWSKPGGDSELPRPNKPDGSEESAVQDPPSRKIIKTKKGHTIQFEDDDDKELILVRDGANGHLVLLDKDGIKITDGVNGHTIVLDKDGLSITEAAKRITMTDTNGNTATMDDSGISCEDKSGNLMTLDSKGIELTDKNGNKLAMNAGAGFPAGPGVAINDGAKRVCLDGLISWLLQHQHVGNMGAPTPLFPGSMPDLIQALAAPGSGILSDTIKVK